MARGWESKDVEAQVAEAEPRKAPSDKGEKSAEQLHREQTVRDLQLSRVRIANDLANARTRTTKNPSKPPSPTSTRKSLKTLRLNAFLFP